MNDILDAGKRTVYDLIVDNYRLWINIIVDSESIAHGFYMKKVFEEKSGDMILKTKELYSEKGEQKQREIDGSWLLNKKVWYCSFLGPFDAEVYVSFYIDEKEKEKSLVEKLQELEESRSRVKEHLNELEKNLEEILQNVISGTVTNEEIIILDKLLSTIYKSDYGKSSFSEYDRYKTVNSTIKKVYSETNQEGKKRIEDEIMKNREVYKILEYCDMTYDEYMNQQE